MTDDARRWQARIPETVRAREKWRIALRHVRRVVTAWFQLAAVVVDADYGSTAAFRRGLKRLGLRYGVAIRWSLAMWLPGARRDQYPEDDLGWGPRTPASPALRPRRPVAPLSPALAAIPRRCRQWLGPLHYDGGRHVIQ